MGLVRCLVCGLLGGAIGAAIWVAVGYLTQYEIGWIAWGVGFLVGVGVLFGANLGGGEDDSSLQGVLAAVLAIGCVVGAKYLLFQIVVEGARQELVQTMSNQGDLTDEEMIAGLADDIAMEMIESGKTVQWPPGMTLDQASVEADYPKDVWRKATAQWNDLKPDDRQERKDLRRAAITSLIQALPMGSFSDMFSPWDLLWLGLAATTAFKIGGGHSDD
ncbi:MAG: hypothetical protein KF777_17445 [Planctomycetaceae bacterium]|nr:hypothetical protein [Planctomycetaceae bacterium]